MAQYDDEIAAAFSEVSDEGMPVRFLLSNAEHTGVAQSLGSSMHLRDPGYEAENQIVIMSPRVQYTRDPSDYAREVLQVMSGAQVGKWIVVSVNADAAFYTFTCRPSL